MAVARWVGRAIGLDVARHIRGAVGHMRHLVELVVGLGLPDVHPAGLETQVVPFEGDEFAAARAPVGIHVE